jgi:hypothetical protein
MVLLCNLGNEFQTILIALTVCTVASEYWVMTLLTSPVAVLTVSSSFVRYMIKPVKTRRAWHSGIQVPLGCSFEGSLGFLVSLAMLHCLEHCFHCFGFGSTYAQFSCLGQVAAVIIRGSHLDELGDSLPQVDLRNSLWVEPIKMAGSKLHLQYCAKFDNGVSSLDM